LKPRPLPNDVLAVDWYKLVKKEDLPIEKLSSVVKQTVKVGFTLSDPTWVWRTVIGGVLFDQGTALFTTASPVTLMAKYSGQ
jgi:hypothetical protein